MVKKVDIFVNDFLCLLKSGSSKLPQRFFFKMSKEVLHRSIIPTISPPRHRGNDVILLDKDSICVGRVLMPLVTVEDQSISDLFFLLGQLQGFGYQRHRIRKAYGMGHNVTAK